MSLGVSNSPPGGAVEIVDDLQMQDVQVTGLSIPILVRIESKRTLNREFVENNVSQYSLRFLTQYVEFIVKDSPMNLTSILYQHNYNPVISYSSEIPKRIKIGGDIEQEICSRLAAIYNQVSAPNIVKQLSWFYLFDQKLEYVLQEWTQVPLVHYILYTVTPTDEISQPFCEPTTRWMYCLRGGMVVQFLSPTPVNVSAFRKFLDDDNEEFLFDLFQTVSIEIRVCRNQVLFIPSGWIYIINREVQTIEYGGEFFHSYAIETQFGVWHLYRDIYLDYSDSLPPPFFTCHWLVLQAYLSSFQDTMLTTKEDGFCLEDNRDLLPHFSPFECRGMLFLIELIRSGRLPLLKQCIPSSVNCAVSLLQKMQTILLHNSIFSTFSSPGPNGIMFVGTPALTNIYHSKSKGKKSKVKRSLMPLVSSSCEQMGPVPTNTDSLDLENESQSLNVSIQLKNVDELRTDILPSHSPHTASSSTSNYHSILSELSKSSNHPISNYSDNSEDSASSSGGSFTNGKLPIPDLSNPINIFLSSYLTPSVIQVCGMCQFCRFNRLYPRLKTRKCILSRIANLTVTPLNVVNASPMFLRLIQLMRVFEPLCPNLFLNILVKKIRIVSADRLPAIKQSTLADIQEILLKFQSGDNTLATPLNQSTPCKP